MTAYVPDFKHKTIESVFEHKEQLEANCKQPFTYVCFTNEISTEAAAARGLDVIPFSSDKVRNNRELWQNEMKRKDIKEFEAVLALYTISRCADMDFDEIAECDLPEAFRDEYRAVRSGLSEFGDSLEQYCRDKEDALTSACEDQTILYI